MYWLWLVSGFWGKLKLNYNKIKRLNQSWKPPHTWNETWQNYAIWKQLLSSRPSRVGIPKVFFFFIHTLFLLNYKQLILPNIPFGYFKSKWQLFWASVWSGWTTSWMGEFVQKNFYSFLDFNRKQSITKDKRCWELSVSKQCKIPADYWDSTACWFIVEGYKTQESIDIKHMLWYLVCGGNSGAENKGQLSTVFHSPLLASYLLVIHSLLKFSYPPSAYLRSRSTRNINVYDTYESSSLVSIWQC